MSPKTRTLRNARRPTLLILLALSCVRAGGPRGGVASGDFFMTDALPDGERETRVRYGGTTAKETVALFNGSGIVLRQVTDGRRFVQTILSRDGEVMDCEYVRKKSAARKFAEAFEREVAGRGAEALGGVALRRLGGLSELPDGVLEWLDLDAARDRCDGIHDEMRREYRLAGRAPADGGPEEGSGRRRRRSESESVAIFPGTLWCGAGQLARTYGELGPLSEADACCRRHDHCPVRLRPLSHHRGLFNSRAYTVSHCACDRRTTRSAVLVPGTRWCGRGNTGNSLDLGEFGEADRCCRMHDTACPFWIEAMQKKYGLFNWRPNTLMHCRCDERFRSCLKLANTDVSNMVGRLFFNVVQTKCFVLKPVKVCMDRSWWGKCLKMGYIKKAHLKDNMSY